MTKQAEGVSERILACAREEFLEKGYAEASLRTIAAKAGTTTGSIYSRFQDKEGLFGAIVQPAADELTDLFLQIQQNFHEMDSKEQPEQLENYTNSGMRRLLDYVYDHLDEFRLLVNASHGTKYQNFLERLVEIETEYTYKYIQLTEPKGEGTRYITEEFVHIMTTALFESMFEVVRHNMSKERAVRYLEMLERYHYNGWAAIFNS